MNNINKRTETSSTEETSLVVANSDNGGWKISSHFFEIFLPIISSFILWKRRHLLERILFEFDKNCVSALYPSWSKRENLLKWTERKIIPSWIESPAEISFSLSKVWQDGCLLCTLINSAVPGACPNPHRHKNTPPSHGQALAYKYFGLVPVFSNEDFQKPLSGYLEVKFYQYLVNLRNSVDSFLADNCNGQGTFSSSYVARGLGLFTGEEKKKCVFYLYQNSLEEDKGGILILIRGPYRSFGSISTGTKPENKTCLHPTKQNNILMIKSNVKQRFFQTLTSKIIPFLCQTQNEATESKIPIEINKENDRIKITYVPQQSGIHIMCIILDGCHIQGSPFDISVSKTDHRSKYCEILKEKSRNSKKYSPVLKYSFNRENVDVFDYNQFEKFCKKFEIFRSSFTDYESTSEELITSKENVLCNESSHSFVNSVNRNLKIEKLGQNHVIRRTFNELNSFNREEAANDKKINYFLDKEQLNNLRNRNEKINNLKDELDFTNSNYVEFKNDLENGKCYIGNFKDVKINLEAKLKIPDRTDDITNTERTKVNERAHEKLLEKASVVEDFSGNVLKDIGDEKCQIDSENDTVQFEETIISKSNNPAWNFSKNCQRNLTKTPINETNAAFKDTKENPEGLETGLDDGSEREKLIETRNEKRCDEVSRSKRLPVYTAENFKGINFWENKNLYCQQNENLDTVDVVRNKIFAYDNSQNNILQEKPIGFRKNVVKLRKKLFDTEMEIDTFKNNLQATNQLTSDFNNQLVKKMQNSPDVNNLSSESEEMENTKFSPLKLFNNNNNESKCENNQTNENVIEFVTDDLIEDVITDKDKSIIGHKMETLTECSETQSNFPDLNEKTIALNEQDSTKVSDKEKVEITAEQSFLEITRRQHNLECDNKKHFINDVSEEDEYNQNATSFTKNLEGCKSDENCNSKSKNDYKSVKTNELCLSNSILHEENYVKKIQKEKLRHDLDGLLTRINSIIHNNVQQNLDVKNDNKIADVKQKSIENNSSKSACINKNDFIKQKIDSLKKYEELKDINKQNDADKFDIKEKISRCKSMFSESKKDVNNQKTKQEETRTGKSQHFPETLKEFKSVKSRTFVCEEIEEIKISKVKQNITQNWVNNNPKDLEKKDARDTTKFPDISGFIRECNRQSHLEYPKDFAVSRRLIPSELIKTLQTLLARGDKLSKLHKSLPNIYFGENRDRKVDTNKCWRKMRSFDADLLTGTFEPEVERDIKKSLPGENCLEKDRVKCGKRKTNNCNRGGCNYEINQKNLPHGFPSVKKLKSKFEGFTTGNYEFVPDDHSKIKTNDKILYTQMANKKEQKFKVSVTHLKGDIVFREKQTLELPIFNENTISNLNPKNDRQNSPEETLSTSNFDPYGDMKTQFSKAREFFKNLEINVAQISPKQNSKIQERRHSFHNNITKRRKITKGGSFPLTKTSDKFYVRNIYKDVIGDKDRGSFKGAANRFALADALASVPVQHNSFRHNGSDELTCLDVFNGKCRRKSRRSLRSVFNINY